MYFNAWYLFSGSVFHFLVKILCFAVSKRTRQGYAAAHLKGVFQIQYATLAADVAYFLVVIFSVDIFLFGRGLRQL
jgi:hypothetical protein